MESFFLKGIHNSTYRFKESDKCSLRINYPFIIYQYDAENENYEVVFNLAANTVTSDSYTVNGFTIWSCDYSSRIIILENGKRWEGQTLKNSPCGYGILYDKDGQMEYKGFMLGTMRAGFGVAYNPYSNIPIYIGTFYNDFYFGYGQLWSDYGDLVYEGNWTQNTIQKYRKLCLQEGIRNTLPIHSLLTTMVVESGVTTNSSIQKLSIVGYPLLTSLVIKDHCFAAISIFELKHLNQLQTVEIGNYSFTTSQVHSSCIIQHCPALHSFAIGKHSFEHFEVLQIERTCTLSVFHRCISVVNR